MSRRSIPSHQKVVVKLVPVHVPDCQPPLSELPAARPQFSSGSLPQRPGLSHQVTLGGAAVQPKPDSTQGLQAFHLITLSLLSASPMRGSA